MADDYPELSGPIPCIDWCDDGKKPEYRGPCTTQPPTTTTTGGLPTNTPKPTPEPTTTEGKSCEDKCYDNWFACMGQCDTEDTVCNSDCGRVHFNCLANC